MRLGLMSDIHGNLVALDAVLADTAAASVDAWWVLGDLVLLGAEPVAVLERLTGLPDVAFVAGNTERYVVTGDRPYPHATDVARDPSLRARFDEVEAGCSWTRDAIDAAGALGWLGTLPAEQRMTLPDGTRVLGVHASPGRDDGPGISPDVPDADLAAMLAGAAADAIFAGHTHRATDRTVAGGRAVNLGSVSNAVVADRRASYVTIDARSDGFDLAHHWVDYDHDEVIVRIRRSGHPASDYLAGFQRTGRADPNG